MGHGPRVVSHVSSVPISDVRALSTMIDSEELLKQMNLRLARFGDSDVASERSLLPYSIPSQDAHRLYREIAAKLVLKIE